MKYKKIVQGEFLERPNRFIAQVKIDNKIETVHVKNTGRCRELLTPNALVYLEDCEKPERKTRYDLVAVMKGNRLINMDSQAPNGAVLEWLKRADFFTDVTKIKPETKYGNSRFDFYIEAGGRKIFMEVKGVTLENDNVVSFPDAPSERAIKHIEELVEAVGEGYDAYICFVIQMKDVDYFKPNGKTQPAFVEALQKASKAGVHIIAFDCQVTQDAMHIRKPVEVRLYEDEILHQMVDPLLKWYEKGHRELPWRTDPTPYHVWISEIMLQQTRVEAVKPYYHRFMEALPTIEALATVEEDKLLKLWEGLGYYNRARNLQKAAIQIVEQHQGNMPNHYQALLSLPGIGTYTAGAIASIAYGEAVPAVDGNVLRVISRLRMDGEDILQGKVKKRVEEELIEVIPKEQSGNFNQALMELGATVCIPNGVPKCDCCPWEKICLAHRENVISEYPVKTKKKARTIEKKTILLIEDNDKIVINKREEKGLLAGLYEFPALEGHQGKKAILKYLEKLGIQVGSMEKVESAKHIFTHKEWHMIGFLVKVDSLEQSEIMELEEGFLVVETEEIETSYPIPSAYSAYSKYVNIRVGNEKYKKKKAVNRIG